MCLWKIKADQSALYLLIYFQLAQCLSKEHSGVNVIVFVLPTIVTISVISAIVSKWGHYVSLSLLDLLSLLIQPENSSNMIHTSALQENQNLRSCMP